MADEKFITGESDPKDFNADTVNAHLSSLEGDEYERERARVLELEETGKARKGVLDGPHASEGGTPEGDEDGEEGGETKTTATVDTLDTPQADVTGAAVIEPAANAGAGETAETKKDSASLAAQDGDGDVVKLDEQGQVGKYLPVERSGLLGPTQDDLNPAYALRVE